MRLPGPVRSTTAFCLLALLGALGTGLPSHHHEHGRSHDDHDLRILAASHHSHGTQLVEQDSRTPSGAPQVALSTALVVDLVIPSETAVEMHDGNVIRPTGRAPPPGAPRAPPIL